MKYSKVHLLGLVFKYSTINYEVIAVNEVNVILSYSGKTCSMTIKNLLKYLNDSTYKVVSTKSQQDYEIF